MRTMQSNPFPPVTLNEMAEINGGISLGGLNLGSIALGVSLTGLNVAGLNMSFILSLLGITAAGSANSNSVTAAIFL